MSEATNKAADIIFSSFGQKGVILITDTTSVSGNFRAIQILSDTVFNTLTSEIKKNGDSTAAAAADFGTIAAGTILYGKFTVVKLTSGKVILYK